jgi:hypothetical protein
MVFAMFSAMAEFERSVISERMKAGMAAARRRGLAGSLSDFVLLIDALFPLSRFYGGCSAPQHTGRELFAASGLHLRK